LFSQVRPALAPREYFEIDNETLTAACDSGLIAANDAERALERLVARVFSLGCAA
jgi:predicted RNA-binding protein associated with RNAse of E/G family